MIDFSHTVFYVSEVDTTIDFYERALGLQCRRISEDGQYGELSTGGATLGFASFALALSNIEHGFLKSTLDGRPCGMHISFTTNNVEEAYRHAVAEGAVPEAPPEVNSHGQTVAFFRDLNGFLVELTTPYPIL